MSDSPTPATVPDAFDEVADSYDLMVALNPGYHAHLRSAAAVAAETLATLPTLPPQRLRVLDLGCGSGASTRALLRALEGLGRPFDLDGVDASAGMLRAAAAKSWPTEVSFRQARAEDLARHEEPGSYHAIFAAYLLRNVDETDRDALLSRLRTLLAPGGVLVLHEYSVAGNRLATAVWTAVSLGIVVPLGRLTSGTGRLYRYLWRSVLDFDAVSGVMGRLQRAGFADVKARTWGGWQHGIIHTFVGRAP